MKFLKIFFFAALLVSSSVVFFGTHEAEAQANCQVTSAKFRTNRVINQSFYLEGNRPFVYIDIETAGCIGQSIEVSITELDDDEGLDNINDDDLNGQIGIADPCNNGNSSCMDNRVIPVTTNDFTLALRAGEEECEQDMEDDCEYYIRINDNVLGGVNDFSVALSNDMAIGYDCVGACETTWFYYGILESFGGSRPDDPDYDPGDGAGTTGSGDGSGTTGSGDGAGTTGGTDGGSGAQTVIELGLQNPLAGTIDTLPQLLQKIVYIFMRIAVPLIAMAILYSGFLFVTAQGRDDQLKKAKATFTLAVIGGLILLGAYLLAEAIRDALTTINN